MSINDNIMIIYNLTQIHRNSCNFVPNFFFFYLLFHFILAYQTSSKELWVQGPIKTTQNTHCSVV